MALLVEESRREEIIKRFLCSSTSAVCGIDWYLKYGFCYGCTFHETEESMEYVLM